MIAWFVVCILLCVYWLCDFPLLCILIMWFSIVYLLMSIFVVMWIIYPCVYFCCHVKFTIYLLNYGNEIKQPLSFLLSHGQYRPSTGPMDNTDQVLESLLVPKEANRLTNLSPLKRWWSLQMKSNFNSEAERTTISTTKLWVLTNIIVFFK